MAEAQATIFGLLSSGQKLERDRGVVEIQKFLSGIDPENYELLVASLLDKLSQSQDRWESRHGLLTAGKIVAEHVWCSDEFAAAFQDFAEACLEDAEYRIRVAAGEALGALCKRHGGTGVYTAVGGRAMDAVRSGLEQLQHQPHHSMTGSRGVALHHAHVYEAPPPEQASVVGIHLSPGISRRDGAALPLPMRRLAAEQEGASASADSRYGGPLVLSGSPRTSALMTFERNNADSPGQDHSEWSFVETWMKCLQCMIEGCSATVSADGCLSCFNAFVDEALLDLLDQTVRHCSRYVREAGLHLCAAVVDCNGPAPADTKMDFARTPSAESPVEGEAFMYMQEGSASGEGGMQPPMPVTAVRANAVHVNGDQLAATIALGLVDNWSLVRLAACQAARQFLLAFTLEERLPYFPLLLPRMCLNRYYVVEGIRNYSQESWKQVTESRGKEFVGQLLESMVEFYMSQTSADNHAVREAACTCIAELAYKVDRELVRPFIGDLVDTIMVFLADENWPVRDAACTASSHFVQHHSAELAAKLPALLALLQQRLQDNAATVRQGAAAALAAVAAAPVSGPQVADELLRAAIASFDALVSLGSRLPAASAMDAADSVGSPTAMDETCGKDAPSDSGTLPRMPAARCCDHPRPWELADGYACIKCKSHRPPEAWEIADGCVHLLCHLAALPAPLPARVASEAMPRLAKASACCHHPQHLDFLESVCKQLPTLAQKVGKQNFKKCLNAFFDPVFYALTSENPCASSAASQCLNQLSSFVGPDILRGRVEQHNLRYLEHLEANDAIAPM